MSHYQNMPLDQGFAAALKDNLELRAEIERLRDVLKIVDDDVRHHLRSDDIAPALIRPHAIKAVRAALEK